MTEQKHTDAHPEESRGVLPLCHRCPAGHPVLHISRHVRAHSRVTLLVCLPLPSDCKLHVVTAWVVVIFPIPIPTPTPFFFNIQKMLIVKHAHCYYRLMYN